MENSDTPETSSAGNDDGAAAWARLPRYLSIYLGGQECNIDADEPSDYVYEWNGTIRLTPSACGGRSEVIGRFRVQQVDGNTAFNHGIAPYEVYDSSQVTWDCYEALFDDDELRPAALAALPFESVGWSVTVLLLDRIEIKPKYRGRGYALLVLNALMRRFWIGASLVAMKPFPLQYEGAMPPVGHPDYVKTNRAFHRDKLKLQRYYSALGFRLVKGTDFMVRATDTRLEGLSHDDP